MAFLYWSLLLFLYHFSFISHLEQDPGGKHVNCLKKPTFKSPKILINSWVLESVESSDQLLLIPSLHSSPTIKARAESVSKKWWMHLLKGVRKSMGERASIVSTAKNMRILLADTLEKLRHKFPAPTAHKKRYQKPWPTLKKIIPSKRICIIQQS